MAGAVHLSELRSERKVWIARPGDVNPWRRQRSKMKLLFEDGRWRIEGPGREHARIGFAYIKDDQSEYTPEEGSVDPAILRCAQPGSQVGVANSECSECKVSLPNPDLARCHRTGSTLKLYKSCSLDYHLSHLEVLGCVKPKKIWV